MPTAAQQHYPPQRRNSGPDALEVAVERALVLAFAPLHKRVFGIAIGTACALFVAGITMLTVIRDPGDTIGLGLLSVYFRGYTVTWSGVVIGGAWAGIVGFGLVHFQPNHT